MIQKLLCLAGYHEWLWSLASASDIDLKSHPPDHAVCKHCGVQYKSTKELNQGKSRLTSGVNNK